MPHIVDTLIEERAEELMKHPALWRLVTRLLYPVLGYHEAVRMADAVAEMGGLEIFEMLSERLKLDIDLSGAEHVPASGSAVVTANHPTGIADGVAVFDALRTVRSDITLFANRDAIRFAPGLADMIVPVEWVDDKRTHARNRETVSHMVRAFRAGRLIVIFPSGRLARPTARGLVERGWTPTAVNLAQKYRCPIVPMNIRGRNSWLYYLLYAINTELKDMTLFRELLNKVGQPYRIRIAEPFEPQGDARMLTMALREFVADAMPTGRQRFTVSDTDTLAPAPYRSS
ncbi:MAG: acyltransferase [Pseudomonadales bacterium]|nr:acyltransferase [Pseudomonadales bacterium]NIX08646.1 acyltransferase [Pseudomonadales bacterium]